MGIRRGGCGRDVASHRRVTPLAVAVAVFATALLSFAPMTPARAAAAPVSEREIESLMAALGTSRCRFERNGDWYDAATAESHLRRKYTALRKRDPAMSAERFIEHAATRSSMSGRAYHVHCPGQQVEPSAGWFQRTLRSLRRTTAGEH